MRHGVAPGPPAYPPLSPPRPLSRRLDIEAEAMNDHQGRIAPPTLAALSIRSHDGCQGVVQTKFTISLHAGRGAVDHEPYQNGRFMSRALTSH